MRRCRPKECGRCGDYKHLAKDCPHADKNCSVCGKIGHLKTKCNQAEAEICDAEVIDRAQAALRGLKAVAALRKAIDKGEESKVRASIKSATKVVKDLMFGDIKPLLWKHIAEAEHTLLEELASTGSPTSRCCARTCSPQTLAPRRRRRQRRPRARRHCP